MALIPLCLSCLLLAIVSITEVGLVSSMVGFLYDQRHHVSGYQINWPDNTVLLRTMPEHLWVDQGHTTNGAAGYGFVIGIFGLVVAWMQQRRDRKGSSWLFLALTIGLLLSTILTLAALIFTFVVTNQTDDQPILESLVRPGVKYSDGKWTPENWYKSLLDLPLDASVDTSSIRYHMHLMEAWRWMLVPLFIIDNLTFAVAVWAVMSQRRYSRVSVSPEK